MAKPRRGPRPLVSRPKCATPNPTAQAPGPRLAASPVGHTLSCASFPPAPGLPRTHPPVVRNLTLCESGFAQSGTGSLRSVFPLRTPKMTVSCAPRTTPPCRPNSPFVFVELLRNFFRGCSAPATHILRQEPGESLRSGGRTGMV